jgi:hypothetical protein
VPVDVRDDAAYAISVDDDHVVVRVHPDRPDGAGPGSAPTVRGQRVSLTCRRSRYSVNADNSLVDELGPDQTLLVGPGEVKVCTAVPADNPA